MGLSCDCGWDDYDWYFAIEEEWRWALTDFKCYGCCEYHRAGEMIRRIWNKQYDEDGEVENEHIIGRICEPCADQYDSLLELWFCMTADFGFIRDAMNDYRNDYVR